MQDTVRLDTGMVDTTGVRRFRISPDAVDMPIVYNAIDSQYISM